MTGLTITRAGSSDHAMLPAFRVAIYYTNASGTKTFIGEYGVASHSSEVHITAVATPGTTTYADATKTNLNVTAAVPTFASCIIIIDIGIIVLGRI